MTKSKVSKKASKKTSAASKKSRNVEPNHPTAAEMVKAAIGVLNERNGSSVQAIKKYIASTYKIDAEKQVKFIKKYLKTAVDGKTIIQTKGSGASGSFKLAKAEKTEKSEVKKSATAKKTPARKNVTTKKSAAVNKPVKGAVKKATGKKPMIKKTAPSKVAKSVKANVKKSGKAKSKSLKLKKAAALQVKSARI